MFVKYSLDYKSPSVIRLALWILLIPHIFCSTNTCPPPDFPAGGSYTQVGADYEVGVTISYSCQDGLWMFGAVTVTCQPDGRWSGKTPFCGMHHLEITLSEGESTKEELCETYSAVLEEDTWVPFICKNKDLRAKYLIVRNLNGTTNATALCEITAYANDANWCEDPPENDTPNSQLEVSRRNALLSCNEGFREKDGRRVYAICDDNKWWPQSVQCIDKNESPCDPFTGNVKPSEGMWSVEGNTSIMSVGTRVSLKCMPGYHTEGEPLTVTCYNNGIWTRTSATCEKDEPENDAKITDIGLGSVAVLVILVLLSLIIFLTKRQKT